MPTLNIYKVTLELPDGSITDKEIEANHCIFDQGFVIFFKKDEDGVELVCAINADSVYFAELVSDKVKSLLDK